MNYNLSVLPGRFFHSHFDVVKSIFVLTEPIGKINENNFARWFDIDKLNELNIRHSHKHAVEISKFFKNE